MSMGMPWVYIYPSVVGHSPQKNPRLVAEYWALRLFLDQSAIFCVSIQLFLYTLILYIDKQLRDASVTLFFDAAQFVNNLDWPAKSLDEGKIDLDPTTPH